MNKIMDIVNNKIDVTKDTIVFYNLLLKKLDKEETAYKISKENFEESQEELKFLIKIKKYLEVLEILKNKTKYMLEDEVDRFEIFSLDEKISKEDFDKVKQWLEENE